MEGKEEERDSVGRSCSTTSAGASCAAGADAHRGELRSPQTRMVVLQSRCMLYNDCLHPAPLALTVGCDSAVRGGVPASQGREVAARRHDGVVQAHCGCVLRIIHGGVEPAAAAWQGCHTSAGDAAEGAFWFRLAQAGAVRARWMSLMTQAGACSECAMQLAVPAHKQGRQQHQLAGAPPSCARAPWCLAVQPALLASLTC